MCVEFQDNWHLQISGKKNCQEEFAAQMNMPNLKLFAILKNIALHDNNAKCPSQSKSYHIASRIIGLSF